MRVDTRRWVPCRVMVYVAAVIAVVVLPALVWFAAVRRLLNRPRRIAAGRARQPRGAHDDGRKRRRALRPGGRPHAARRCACQLWSPMHLERLARTYWRFLSRCTLGIVRVRYDEDERAVVLLTKPFVLLRFRAPEYEMDSRRGVVRWRIASGVLVSQAGRDADGYLQIEVERCPTDVGDERARARRGGGGELLSGAGELGRALVVPRRRSRASTSSSRTASCARSPAWTWPSRSSGATPRRPRSTPCPTRRPVSHARRARREPARHGDRAPGRRTDGRDAG